jgi:hypothetical protein
MDNRRREKRSR